MTGDIPILMYHSVCGDGESAESEFVVQRSVFRRQLEFLKKEGFRTPPPSGLLDGSARRTARDILITFDDGYRDNYENALPVLREFGFTALIFLVGDFSRRTNWWDAAKGIKDTSLMDRSTVATMQAEGIEFGAHTMHHRSLPGLSDNELKTEIDGSKAAIEDIIEGPVRWFAYPYGDVDRRVKRAVREAGYAAAVATNSGPLRASSDLFEMRRVPVENNPSPAYMSAKVFGRDKQYRWLRWRVKRLLGMHNRYQSELGYGQ